MKKMKFLTIGIFCMLVLCRLSYGFEDNERYNFYFPDWRLEAKDFKAPVMTYSVVLIQKNGNTFQIKPEDRSTRWATGLKKDGGQHGLNLVLLSEKKVKVYGLIGSGITAARVTMTGQSTGGGEVKGSAEIVVLKGADARETKVRYYCEWGMSPAISRSSPKISDKVKYSGPKAKTIKATVPTERERQNQPSLTLEGLKRYIKRINKHENLTLTLPDKATAYYEKVDLSREEVLYTPGIVFYANHMATVPKDLRFEIGSYIKDGSRAWFPDLSYDELAQIPTPLLLLACLPHMPPDQADGLAQTERVSTLLSHSDLSRGEIAKYSLPELTSKLVSSMPPNRLQPQLDLTPRFKEYLKKLEQQGKVDTGGLDLTREGDKQKQVGRKIKERLMPKMIKALEEEKHQTFLQEFVRNDSEYGKFYVDRNGIHLRSSDLLPPILSFLKQVNEMYAYPRVSEDLHEAVLKVDGVRGTMKFKKYDDSGKWYMSYFIE